MADRHNNQEKRYRLFLMGVFRMIATPQTHLGTMKAGSPPHSPPPIPGNHGNSQKPGKKGPHFSIMM